MSAKLVVEADGGQHYSKRGEAHDAKRDDFLRNRGFVALRFSDRDILANIDGVVGKIMEYIDVVK
jgi:very-short-patch-repair endonuclease